MLAFDTETHLIRPGLQAPPLVCLSWADARGVDLVLKDGARAALDVESGDRWLGHNIAMFDLPVLIEAGIVTFEEVFGLLDEGAWSDTLIREKLLDIASGEKFYRTADGKTHKRKYDLGDLVRKYLNEDRSNEKTDPNGWRLRYAELDGVPLDQWPEGAISYAKTDASDVWRIWHLQEERRARIASQLGGDPLADEPRQMRRAFALGLMRAWGIKTSPQNIEELRAKTNASFAELKEKLVPTGIVRPDGSRDTKAAKARMLRVCAENRIPVTITDTGEKKIKAGLLDEAGAIAAGYIGLDADTCKRTGDLALQDYCEINSHQLVLSRDVKRFVRGTRLPIHTRINSIVDTGRPSSSDPNLFNVRNLPGIRECFVPRPGRWFLSADVSGLELATLAQVLGRLVGWSSMADTIRKYGSAGALHTIFAARLLGISIEEAFRREALGKKADLEFYNARQTAKVANFGFPGGLGVASLIYFARAKKVILTEEQAKRLKAEWLDQWPEMRNYFALIGGWCEDQGGQCTIRQLFSDRFRGRCFYTEACNGFFQSLGADATGHALFEIQRACYADQSSPLFGARLVNYVYDEFLLEVWANVEKANAAAVELVTLAEREANYFLPDVPIKMGEPVLMSRWSKEAKPTRNEKGQLILCP